MKTKIVYTGMFCGESLSDVINFTGTMPKTKKEAIKESERLKKSFGDKAKYKILKVTIEEV